MSSPPREFPLHVAIGAWRQEGIDEHDEQRADRGEKMIASAGADSSQRLAISLSPSPSLFRCRRRHRQSLRICATPLLMAMPTLSPAAWPQRAASCILLAHNERRRRHRASRGYAYRCRDRRHWRPCRKAVRRPSSAVCACSGRTTTVTRPSGLVPAGKVALISAPEERTTVADSPYHRLHVAGEKIRLADEVGDETLGRPVVDFPGRADLQDFAARHHGDAIRHRQRLFLVMGDEDEGDAGLALQPLQLDLHFLAQLVVERRQRFVEQQDLRLRRQRAGERHPLLLAAGDLAGPPVAQSSSMRTSFSMATTRASTSLFGLPSISSPKPIFCGDRHVREQRVALEDRVDRPLVGRQRRNVVCRKAGFRRCSGNRSRRSGASSVVLPQPEGPSSVKNSFSRMETETAVERRHLMLAGTEELAYPARLDRRLVCPDPSRASILLSPAAPLAGVRGTKVSITDATWQSGAKRACTFLVGAARFPCLSGTGFHEDDLLAAARRTFGHDGTDRRVDRARLRDAVAGRVHQGEGGKRGPRPDPAAGRPRHGSRRARPRAGLSRFPADGLAAVEGIGPRRLRAALHMADPRPARRRQAADDRRAARLLFLRRRRAFRRRHVGRRSSRPTTWL